MVPAGLLASLAAAAVRCSVLSIGAFWLPFDALFAEIIAVQCYRFVICNYMIDALL